jgi:outer membrane protein OmpA-like peptidoglycan-associated protein
MRTLHLLSALAIGATAFVIAPKPAHAEGFSLHLEGGAAIPMTNPQDKLFDTGLVLGAKGMFALNPNFSIGPSMSSAYLPRSGNTNDNAGVLWQFGGSARLQGNRSFDTHGQYSSGWSPWVDADVMAAYTGHLPLPAFDVGVGEELALDHAHAAWLGPFVRYTHVFQTADQSGGLVLNKSDINILQAGLSLSFDFPPRVYNHHHVVREHTVSVYYVPVQVEKQAVVQPATPETFTLTEHVFFDHDSSTLRWESRDKLDQVAKKLAAHPDMMIAVQGHASVDGQLEHNVKLSQARADQVVDYLAAHGVKREQLRADSFGVSVPATNDKSQEGLERSRRVEFTVVFTSFRK